MEVLSRCCGRLIIVVNELSPTTIITITITITTNTFSSSNVRISAEDFPSISIKIVKVIFCTRSVFLRCGGGVWKWTS